MQAAPKYHVGLPQWNHSGWHQHVLAGNPQSHTLGKYARYFNSVEGNTTFYGLPDTISLDRWKNEVPSDFKFCFKLPKSITHQAALRHCSGELVHFFNTMQALQDRIGLISIQLPAAFNPSELDTIKEFFRQLPQDWLFTIEVRHQGFFDKQDNEQRFNQLLMQHQINRTMFDTRTLFAYPKEDEITLDALQKKPRVPLHVIATGKQPTLRFISPLDWQQAIPALQPWLQKIELWIEEGKTPYLFFHTPDNQEAPELALYFCEQLQLRNPELINPLNWPLPQTQDSLF